MSVHTIIYKDGAKMMRPVLTETEYRNLRNSPKQKMVMKAIRDGDENQKTKLLQMNYSCLPNEDGSLKGSTRMSTTVGMDIDHIKPEEMEAVKDNILANAAELGLKMLEKSARGKGYHLVFTRKPELSQEENLKWASELLGVPYDEGAKDITRVFFTTTDSEEDLIYLDDEIFEIEETPSVPKDISPSKGRKTYSSTAKRSPSSSLEEEHEYPRDYHGVPYLKIVEAWLGGKKVKEGDRHRTSLYLADHLRYITENDAGLIEKILRETPFVQEIIEERGENVAQTVKSAQGYDFYKNIPKKMQEALRKVGALDEDSSEEPIEADVDNEEFSAFNSQLSTRKMPQGVRDSINAVGPTLAMPVVTAICPCIGALATGVVLDVHGRKRGLNLIAYIAGDFASGKGDIDPVVDAWMSEVSAVDKMYLQQEEEFCTKKQAAKNKKEQPEEPKLPIRYVTLNTTVAKLAERLANTEGKHAYSFTPEADTVAQKLKTAISDFSVMLRESYDGSKFDREAKSLEAVNVHIDHLLWNVTMCGTPDALYRVVRNYTDGFQSRIAVARTPDNTFMPLEDKPHVLTERQSGHIQQVAHLLPLMYGEVVLPKLEAKGREWLERIRLETMKNDDRIKARQRFRVCVTAQRMTCCIMLCKVCETLIQKYGLNGAEARLKSHPNLWKEQLLKAQTPQMLEVFDVIADSLMENALHFFRDRIENAFTSRDYAGNNERQRMGKNDSIFERLDVEFCFEQAMQHSIAIKGAGVTRNTVQQMLKNWKRQGLVSQTEANRYRKMTVECH